MGSRRRRSGDRVVQVQGRRRPASGLVYAEAVVVTTIRAIGRDPGVVAATVAATRAQAEEARKALVGERAALERQRRDDEAELRRRTAKPVTDEYTAGLVADLQDGIRRAGRRLTEIREEEAAMAGEWVDAAEVARVLAVED